MNEELIERFNAEIQTIEQLTTNTIQQQKEIYQQKQENIIQWKQSDEYKQTQQTIQFKQSEITKYQSFEEKQNQIETKRNEIQKKKEELEAMKLLQKMLERRCSVEAQLSLLQSSSFTDDKLDSFYDEIKLYKQFIDDSTIEYPPLLQTLSNQFILKFTYYVKEAEKCISAKLTRLIKQKKFPFQLDDINEDDWKRIRRYYEFIVNMNELQEVNDVDFDDFDNFDEEEPIENNDSNNESNEDISKEQKEKEFHQKNHREALKVVMGYAVSTVEQIFMKEGGKLYQPISIDLLLPYIIELLEKAKTQIISHLFMNQSNGNNDNLNDKQNTKERDEDLMSCFLPVIQRRLHKDIMQLPALYTLILIQSFAKYSKQYHILLECLTEKKTKNDIFTQLLEIARIKVEHVITLDNNIWHLPFVKGCGEFLLVVNEAVGFCLQIKELALEYLSGYVIPLIDNFASHLETLGFVGNLKVVCSAANSWQVIVEAIETNLKRIQMNGIDFTMLLGYVEDYQRNAKSDVLVIVEDMHQVMRELKFKSFEEAIEQNHYLRKKNEEVKSYLHPDLYTYFFNEMLK